MNQPYYSPPPLREPQPVLYHYTSRDGLLGIVEKKEIWASNVRYLNDAKEITTATELAHSVLDSFIRNASELEEKKILEAFRGSLISLDSQIQSYVVSLSEDGDQLSQWRGYCKPGNGYAIGFKTDTLQQAARTQGFTLHACRYEESDQRELITNVFKAGLDILRAHSNKSMTIKSQEFTLLVIMGFLGVAPLIKDKSFKDENEWRFIAPLGAGQSPDLCFRPGKSMLIPFLPLKFSGGGLPIADLVIGPSPHKELDSIAVLAMLRRKDVIATSCRFSSVPYRDW